MAKMIAKTCNAAFQPIDFSTIYNKYLGESEKYTKSIFTVAKKLAPTIIFIDEIDVFLKRRGGQGEHEVLSQTKGQFMSYWDGYSSNNNERIMVLGATNRPFDLDEAILRRMPQQILFGLPDINERESILKIYQPKDRIHPDIASTIYTYLSKHTEEYNGSDLKELCKCAAMQPMREYTRQYHKQKFNTKLDNECKDVNTTTIDKPKPRLLVLKDFQYALEHIKPTGREAMEHLQEFCKKSINNSNYFTYQNVPRSLFNTNMNHFSNDIPQYSSTNSSDDIPITQSKSKKNHKKNISAKNLAKYMKQFRIELDDLDSNGILTNSGIQKLCRIMGNAQDDHSTTDD